LTDPQPRESSQKKKIASVVGGVLGLFLLALAGGVGKQLAAELIGKDSSPRAGDPASHEVLSKTADQINRTLPMMVDKDTELMATAGLPGVLVYRYRLVRAQFEELDSADLESFRKGMHSTLINGACTTPQTRDNLLRRGVTMLFMYTDKEGKFLVSIDIKAADCGF
jgi:hypothetical protein